jgi:hypothetical protein
MGAEEMAGGASVMKIEDKIYIPHICPECSTARVIPRDDLHDHPKIICTECGGVMRRWVIHKEAPQSYFSDGTFDLLTYTQKRREITGSPWYAVSGSLVDARRKVKQDLVDDPGPADMVFMPSEVRAAELRAELMVEKIEDIVVTMVYKVFYGRGKSGIYVESLRHSQVIGKVKELNEKGTIKVMMVYSEETHQLFGWNDLEIDEPPRLPGYDVKYDKKRTGFRSPSSGVIQ